MSRKQTHELTVIIEARSKRALDDAIESLSRSACDIANSTDGIRIYVSDALPEPTEARERGLKPFEDDGRRVSDLLEAPDYKPLKDM